MSRRRMRTRTTSRRMEMRESGILECLLVEVCEEMVMRSENYMQLLSAAGRIAKTFLYVESEAWLGVDDEMRLNPNTGEAFGLMSTMNGGAELQFLKNDPSCFEWAFE
jgi:hypothetical protein